MSFSRVRVPAFAIALLALAASATGIPNGFTYDDAFIIEQNPAMRDVTQWWRAFASSYWPAQWSGDGYRPLTILAFKVEYLLGGGRPIAFHVANILLYALSAVLVFLLARRLLPMWAAWCTAALFAVHPVHVEAVANVVGQSELLVAIAVVGATTLYLRDRSAGAIHTGTAVAITALYAFASLAKEHGLVLPAILIAAELTVIADGTPWRDRVRRLRPFYLVLALVGVCTLWARSVVLAGSSVGGFATYAPFTLLQTSATDRVLTAVGVVPEWLRLLYWPAHLSSEYGPPGIEIAHGLGVAQLPGLMLLIAILALAIVLRRRLPVLSFGIAFGCLALLPASNFLLPAGIVIAERTLFLPSVGAVLALGAAFVWGAEQVQRNMTAGNVRRLRIAAIAFGAAVLLVGGTRSAQRSTVWRDNERLFRQAAIDAPEAYHAHALLGQWYFTKQRLRDGEAELRRAIELFPYDPTVSYTLAEHYSERSLCGAAIPLYELAFRVDTNFQNGRTSLAECLLRESHFVEAKHAALDAVRIGAEIRAMHRLISVSDSLVRMQRGGRPTSNETNQRPSSKVPESMQKAPGQSGVTDGI